MPLTSVQAAIVAIITEIVGLIVAFGVISNEAAGIVTGSATTLVAAVFVIANAVIHHGTSIAGK